METGPRRLEKRFVIQEDAFAREKLEAFRNAIESLQKVYPEIRGATAYGSLTKGEAGMESDVDSYVLIDLSMATRTIEKNAPEYDDFNSHPLGKMPPEFNSRNHLMMNIYDDPTPAEITQRYYHNAAGPDDFYEKLIADATRAEFSALVSAQKEKAEAAGQIFERPKGLEIEPIIFPMSKSAIDAVIDERLKPDGRKTGMWSTPGTTSKRGKDRDYIQTTVFARNFSPLFHLEVAGDVRAYRSHLLARLKQAGPDGEKMWSEISDFLLRWETSGGKRSIRVPKTLDEALRAYAPKFSDTQPRLAA